MQPKVIRLPEYAKSATPDFVMRKAERDNQPDPVEKEVKEVEREEVPEFIRRRQKQSEPEPAKPETEKEIPALPEPMVIEAEWEEVKEEKNPSKSPNIEEPEPTF